MLDRHAGQLVQAIGYQAAVTGLGRSFHAEENRVPTVLEIGDQRAEIVGIEGALRIVGDEAGPEHRSLSPRDLVGLILAALQVTSFLFRGELQHMAVFDVAGCQLFLEPAGIAEGILRATDAAAATQIQETVNAGTLERLEEGLRRVPVDTDGKELLRQSASGAYLPRDRRALAGVVSSKRLSCPLRTSSSSPIGRFP